MDNIKEILSDQGTQALSQILVWVKSTVESSEGFVREQVPLFIKEFLAWNFVEYTAYGILMFVLAIICFIGISFGIKYFFYNKGNINNERESKIVVAVLSTIICGVAIMPLLCGTVNYTLTAIKIKVAPRVYLVDWLRGEYNNQNGVKK